ncbi:YihY/virulence factor BrkB family protein [Actinoplanes subtropicus]|uniref:YihY/virulence factor BrkB family protein n=1 Tax=Actinoplanes subtropicus TaxID=543632 RepID=UPI0004C2BAC4|nr:YihY/virulence factor BrkB family protein [Actinoplanes subtropicus]
MKLGHHDDDESKTATVAPQDSPEAAHARARGAEDFDLAAAATTRTGADANEIGETIPPSAGPSRPSQLRPRGIFAAVRRTFKQYSEDNISDWAAALTYYGILSIFPAALVLVSLLGFLNKNGQQTVTDTIKDLTGNKQIQDLTGTVLGQVQGSGKASFAAILGIVVAFWSASGYIAAFMRASNAVYDVPEGRPIWKTLPIRVGVTAVVGLMLIVSAFIVVFTGSLAQVVGEKLGFGGVAVTTWNIAKWPVLVILISLMFAILYWASPNAKTGGFRWVSPGGIFAVVLWLAASAAFAIYLANFANYNKTYGTLGGVIAFLVWLWISNIAILLGAELDAELERGRAIAAGHDPSDEPFLELRDSRKLKKGSEKGLTVD